MSTGAKSRKRKLSTRATNGDLLEDPLEAKQKKSKSFNATNKETLTQKQAKKPLKAARSKTAPRKGTRVFSSPETEDLDESTIDMSGDDDAKSVLDVILVDDDDDDEAAEESAEVELGTKLHFFVSNRTKHIFISIRPSIKRVDITYLCLL